MALNIHNHFKSVVNNIFSNWTALQLAVEHGMCVQSKEMISQFEDYMVNFCCNQNDVSVQEIEEALTDILEEEFSTYCEDGSPTEISTILYRFLNLLKDGKIEEFEVELNKLPVQNVSSNKPVSRSVRHEDDSEENEMEVENDAPQEEEEEGWTKINRKKRK